MRVLGEATAHVGPIQALDGLVIIGGMIIGPRDDGD
jgi:hypothetical protein